MISTTLVNEKFDIFINTLKDAVDMFLPIEKTYVYASDKPWITGKIKSFIAKCRKLPSLERTPQRIRRHVMLYKRSARTVKSAFMTGKTVTNFPS